MAAKRRRLTDANVARPGAGAARSKATGGICVYDATYLKVSARGSGASCRSPSASCIGSQGRRTAREVMGMEVGTCGADEPIWTEFLRNQMRSGSCETSEHVVSDSP